MDEPAPSDPIAATTLRWEELFGRDSLPSMTAVTSIMRSQQILLRRLNRVLESYDVSYPRWEALMLLYLGDEGSMPLGRMGQRLEIHPTSVTGIVDGLERSGLVRRTPHPTDRRTTLASITERGRAVAHESTLALIDARFRTVPLQERDLKILADLLLRLRRDAGAEIED